MRLASGNPAIVQDAIVESSEGEAAQQEPEHGEDTIAKVKGQPSSGFQFEIIRSIPHIWMYMKIGTTVNSRSSLKDIHKYYAISFFLKTHFCIWIFKATGSFLLPVGKCNVPVDLIILLFLIVFCRILVAPDIFS